MEKTDKLYVKLIYQYFTYLKQNGCQSNKTFVNRNVNHVKKFYNVDFSDYWEQPDLLMKLKIPYRISLF